jgi:hypothetical protein
MTRMIRPMALACMLLGLASCASDAPCRHQDLTVAAPVTSSVLYPGCHGRNVRVFARLKPRGSRVEALKVFVTKREGDIHPEAPSIRVDPGTPVQAITSEGEAGVIYFGCPGPCDGSVIAMTVTVPPSGPCPFRLRLVPVFRTP